MYVFIIQVSKLQKPYTRENKFNSKFSVTKFDILHDD